MHLIILDDDDRISAFIAAVALERGWTVETSTTEAEFQKCHRAHLPDVVVVDLQLGATDGVEQLRFLRREAYAGLVVLMSGFDSRVLASAEQLGRSLGLAIAATFEKPTRAARVIEVMEGLENRIKAAASDLQRARVTPRRLPPLSANVEPSAISQALRRGEMELYLQPILSAADFSVVYLEALIRWMHPQRGMVPPDDFIPVAECDAKLIDELTVWVVETALEHYIRIAGLGTAIPICVNVSGMNLRSLDFPDRVAALVERFGVSPAALAFEVTETVAMRDPSETIDILTRLRLKGFTLALDDFGTGHSSLKALRQMPFTAIKIDKSFVIDMLTSHDSFVIVQSVIDLANNMGMKSVAEGVEDAEIARRLIELGVSSFQGYYFSRPIPVERLVEWLRSRRGVSLTTVEHIAPPAPSRLEAAAGSVTLVPRRPGDIPKSPSPPSLRDHRH
jgi:EAL domain-containing protein (putative c-di-GMP-specific phosphodiesterase class I)/ActR/RegA family two-component response regulator